MKNKKHLNNFEEYKKSKLNISDINDDNILQVIEDLLKIGDIKNIALIMTDFNTKVTKKLHEEADNLIKNSIYKEEIYSLIRSMLGIFG